MTGVGETSRGLDGARPTCAAAGSTRRGSATGCARFGGLRGERSPRRLTLVAALAVGLVLTAPVQPVRAGTYEIRTCGVPGHAPSLLHPWQATDWLVPDVSMVDACPTGGGWSVNFGGPRQVGAGYGAGIFLAKPTGSRSPITFARLTVWYSARLAGSGQPMHFMSGELRPDGFHQVVLAGPPGAENAVAERELSPDTQQLQLALRCGDGGGVSPAFCGAAHGVPLLIHGVKTTLREEVPPIVQRLGGALLEGGPQRGIRTVSYAAADAQSGLSKVDVLLDGSLVASEDLTPGCSYSDFTACPPSADGSVQVDTRAVANGRHRLTLRAWDVAGNPGELHGNTAVEVANEPVPVAPAPVDLSAYELSARFTSTSRPTVTVPYGRRVRIRGRLTRSSQPVAAGSVVEVLEKPGHRGAREVSRARVRTRADGSFSARLVTTRPSRTVRLAYRPTAGGRVVSPALDLRVRARSRVRASLRGSVLRFSGRVLSAPMPKRGKRIVMEGRSPGSAWTPFKTIRTDRRGRFSGTYRLRVRRPGVRLKVRAVVPRQTGYGYLGSRSRAVVLRVR